MFVRHPSFPQLLGICCVLGSTTGQIPRPDITKRQMGEFEWSSITPSAKLLYHDCFDGFQCARLLVPLDWSKHNSTDGLSQDETAAIAMVKIPATVPETDPTFGGPVLYNPGGPGSSGVEMALQIWPWLQGGLLDGDKHFEILGFDPRGVGASTPSIGCYTSDFARSADEDRAEMYGPITSGPTSLSYLLQSMKGFWDLCEDAAEHSNIFSYSSTASVARDMLEIVDSIDAARAPAKKTTSKSKPCTKRPKLQYVGQSYGTFLGTTFASMFPDRVALMLLDGVVDTSEYVATEWNKSLINMDDVVDGLWQKCFDVKDACPLWQQSDDNASDIKARIERFLDDLDVSPIGLGIGGRVQLLTPDSIRERIIAMAYVGPAHPVVLDLMQELAMVMAGDYSEYFESVKDAQERVCAPQSDLGQSDELNPEQAPYSAGDASRVIHCVDAYKSAASTQNISWAQKLVRASLDVSPTLGSVIGQWPLLCYGMPESFKPSYVFQGPFGGPAPHSGHVSDNSSTIVAPILIINNMLDPVTPLSAAYGLSRLHEDSVVVVQDASGHMAIQTAGSCLRDIIRDYFTTGAMPENGTVCQPNLLGVAPPETQDPEARDWTMMRRFEFPKIERSGGTF